MRARRLWAGRFSEDSILSSYYHPKSRGGFSTANGPWFASLHVSPHGETKCVKGPSVRRAPRSEVARSTRRAASARGPALSRQYAEHGEQTQRRNGAPIACFGPQVVRHAG